jgi:hypothetical protein
MRSRYLPFAMFLATGTAVSADYIFNVDFEDPPHTVNQQVVTGDAVNLPTGADPTVIIRTNLADFTTQVASLEPAGAMGFMPDTSVQNGLVSLRWDLAMISLGGGSGFSSAAVAIQSTSDGGLSLEFLDDMTITLNGMNIGTFSLGESDHYEFLFSLDTDVYGLTLNGAPVLADQPLSATFDLQNVLFSRANLEDPTYAVDNFKWEIIPEPSTAILLLLGSLGLAAGRPRNSASARLAHPRTTRHLGGVKL